MAMTFTAHAMAEAQEEPQLRLGHLLYRGRILSAAEWLVFWDRYLDLSDAFASLLAAPGGVDQRALLALEQRSHALRLDYLRAVFPRWRFRFWAPDPVQQLARGHPRDLREAFDSFFSLQARMMYPARTPDAPTAAAPLPSPTAGTPSPPPIIVAPASM